MTPPYYVDEEVLANDHETRAGGWADPEDRRSIEAVKKRKSLVGKIGFDRSGKPLNPLGRTGIGGRGLLGKWGPNLAVDPVITRLNPVTEDLELLLVKRADTGEWGLPGTLITEGETWKEAAIRALERKTGLEVDFEQADLIVQMVVDDYRNTDNAWVETYGVHLHLSSEQLKNGHLNEKEREGVKDVAWVPITPDLVNSLFANHSQIIKKTLEQMLDNPEVNRDREHIREIILQI